MSGGPGSDVAEVRRIWTGRHPRSGADRAYTVYLTLICLGVIGFPLLRALWLWLGTADVQAALAAPGSIQRLGTSLFVVLTSAAMALGGTRGPAVLAPYPTHVLAGSALGRWAVYRRTLLLSLLACVLTGGAACCVLGVGEVLGTGAGPLGVVTPTLAGLAAGAVLLWAWLLGQVLARRAAPVALLLLGVALALEAVPGPTALLPWGWFGHTLASGHPGWELALLGVLALAALATAPSLVERLGTGGLISQAGRWDAAMNAGALLEFGSAAATYQAVPSWGRRLAAVRPSRNLTWQIARADALGALRTPGRLLSGCVLLLLAGAAVQSAGQAGGAAMLLGAGAGISMYFGVACLSTGLTSVLRGTEQPALYGTGELALVLMHAVFPLGAMALLASGSALLAAALGGGAAPAGVLGSLLLGLLCAALRLYSALKGPLPAVLMISSPSPLGDPMPLIRLAWASDALVLAAASGVVLVALPASVAWLLGIVVLLCLLLTRRWRRREGS